MKEVAPSGSTGPASGQASICRGFWPAWPSTRADIAWAVPFLGAVILATTINLVSGLLR